MCGNAVLAFSAGSGEVGAGALAGAAVHPPPVGGQVPAWAAWDGGVVGGWEAGRLAAVFPAVSGGGAAADALEPVHVGEADKWVVVGHGG